MCCFTPPAQDGGSLQDCQPEDLHQNNVMTKKFIFSISGTKTIKKMIVYTCRLADTENGFRAMPPNDRLDAGDHV